MTSLWSRIGLAIALAGMTQVSAAAGQPQATPAPAKKAPVSLALLQVPISVPPAPTALRVLEQCIDALVDQFNGRDGIAVRSVDHGRTEGWKANEINPQQSVSNLWVAITAFDAIDRGRIA